MTGQMAFDLALGFRDEAEADRIADGGRGRAERKRAQVPGRFSRLGRGAELLQPRLAPCEVIAFFARRVFEEGPGLRAAGEPPAQW